MKNKLRFPPRKSTPFNMFTPSQPQGADVPEEEINKIEDLEDGSSVYEVGAPKELDAEKDKFDANLALTMNEETLKNLSAYILHCLDEDTKARETWLDWHAKVLLHMGYSSKSPDKPRFNQACMEVDTTLSTGVIKFTATARAEFYPDSGPCSYKAFGDKEELENSALARKEHMNYYLTIEDDGYYRDCERALFFWSTYGFIVKKVYYDESLQNPLSRFIKPDDFLFNTDCTSVSDSNRLTHVLKLSARDILVNQKYGRYREIDLPYLKSGYKSSSSPEIKSSMSSDAGDKPFEYSQCTLHTVYESHIYLDLDSFKPELDRDKNMSIPKPYIVTIDNESKEILAIKRSWNKDDDNFNRRKYFVPFVFFPYFDVRGQGLARMVGTNAIAVTTMLQQAVDAATYQNIPAGFYKKGSTKQQETDIMLGPGQWKPLECTGDIREMFVTLPANGPSPGLMSLREGMIGQMQDTLSTAELGMMQSREDIPTGTAIAFLEESKRIQSAVHKGLYASITEELGLIDDIFKEIIDRKEFYFAGKNNIITKEDYDSNVLMVPVADPAANSSIQRIAKAEAIFQTAMLLPDKVDTTSLLKMIFEAQGVSPELIASIIIKPEEVKPEDPITENMNMMQNKPVKASLEQNHDAHIVVHAIIGDEQSKAHIQEHMAMKFLLQMQQEMQIDLSQIDMDDPSVQNMIALKAAQAVESLGLNVNTNEGEGVAENETSLENSLLAADIEQKKEANIIRNEIADKQLEGNVFTAQLKFEELKLKLRAAKEQSELKAQIEMEKLRNRL